MWNRLRHLRTDGESAAARRAAADARMMLRETREKGQEVHQVSERLRRLPRDGFADAFVEAMRPRESR